MDLEAEMSEQYYIWHIRFLKAGWDDVTDVMVLARTEVEALSIDPDTTINYPNRKPAKDEDYPSVFLEEGRVPTELGNDITIHRLWPVNEVDKPRVLMQHIRYG